MRKDVFLKCCQKKNWLKNVKRKDGNHKTCWFKVEKF